MLNIQGGKQDVKAVEEYSDDALAEMWDSFGKEAERLGRLSRGALAELTARMLEREATKLDTEHWEGTVKPGAISHTVDDVKRFRERLLALVPMVSPDEIAAAFVQPSPPPLHPDHRVLNELHKQGGRLAAIIDEERRSVRSDSRLELKRKPEAR